MIKGAIEDFFGRIRSPFFLTFILLVIYYNYELILKVYYIDKYSNIDERVVIVKDYVKSQWYCNLSFRPAVSAIFSLTFYYAFQAIGLFIKEFYSIKVRTWILKRVKKGAKTIPEDMYQVLEKNNEYLDGELKKTKGNLALSIQQFKTLEEGTSQKDLQISQSEEKIARLQTDNSIIQARFENSKNEVIEQKKIVLGLELTHNTLRMQLADRDKELRRVNRLDALFKGLNFSKIQVTSIFTPGIWTFSTFNTIGKLETSVKIEQGKYFNALPFKTAFSNEDGAFVKLESDNHSPFIGSVFVTCISKNYFVGTDALERKIEISKIEND